jgi:phage/plasmid-associated DNA primase
MIGENFVAAVPPQDMGSHFVIAQLAGTPVNLALDISKKAVSDSAASFLKACTGEDKSVYNQKFQAATSQRFLCKHLFATNYPLKFNYDRALWNRIQIAPFTVSTAPENQDRKLLKHLLQERDEIVTLAMEAIRRVILNNWQLPPCAVADAMKNAWIGWQIGADEFLGTYCEVEEGAFTSSREMYQQYLRYCERYDFPTAEETGFVLHVKKTFPQLDKRKLKFQGVQRNGFCNLKLKPM